jgi:hypothetical protein
VKKRLEKAVLIGGIDRSAPLFGEVQARSARHLSRVGLTDSERIGDIAERVVERLAQDVDGAFDRGQPFEEEPDRELERLAALGPHLRVDGRGVVFRRPCTDADLPTGAGRGRHVERDPRSDGDEERNVITHPVPVGALPSEPDVLDDVLGIGCTTEHLVGDAEEPMTDVLEAGHRLLHPGPWRIGRRGAG